MTDERDTTDIEQGRYDPPPARSVEELPDTNAPGAHPVPAHPSPGGTPDPDDPDPADPDDRADQGLRGGTSG